MKGVLKELDKALRAEAVARVAWKQAFKSLAKERLAAKGKKTKGVAAALEEARTTFERVRGTGLWTKQAFTDARREYVAAETKRQETKR